MSIIEKAVKRLDQLKSASGEGGFEAVQAPEPLVVPEEKPLAKKPGAPEPVVPPPVRAQPKSVRIDLENAGAAGWVDEPVKQCQANGWTLITSRTPDDLPAFNDAIAKALAG